MLSVPGDWPGARVALSFTTTLAASVPPPVKNRVEPATEQWAVTPVPLVIRLRVPTFDGLHRPRKPADRAVHDEVEMVRHQAVGVDLDAEAVDCVGEQALELDQIDIVAEDVLAVGAAIHQVVPAIGHVGAEWSWHDTRMNGGCDVGRGERNKPVALCLTPRDRLTQAPGISPTAVGVILEAA